VLPVRFDSIYTQLLTFNVKRLFVTRLHYEVKGGELSLASVLLNAFATRLALDFTAPVKRTSTLPPTSVDPGIVAPPTTHRLTSMWRHTTSLSNRAVTAPSARAQRPDRRVQLAVVGRYVQVDEMASHRLLVGGRRATRRPSTKPQEHWSHGSLTVDRLHAPSATVAGRQPVADCTEPRQSDPASLHRARPRQTVTLTLCCYWITQRLQCKQRHCIEHWTS